MHIQGFRKHALLALEEELEKTKYSMDAVRYFLGVCAGWLIGHTLAEDRAITGEGVSKWVNLQRSSQQEQSSESLPHQAQAAYRYAQTMDGKNKKMYEWKKKSAAGTCAGLILFCIYFSIALGLSHVGMEQTGLSLYPFHTLERERLMQEQAGGRDAEILIEENGMLADAYECAVRNHLDKAEYMQAYEDIQGMLKTAGYQIYYYNQAVYGLSISLDMAVRSKDDAGAQRILEEIQGIPGMLEDLKARTSSLAYKIHDRPVFELDEEIEEYIESLSGISLT